MPIPSEFPPTRIDALISRASDTDAIVERIADIQFQKSYSDCTCSERILVTRLAISEMDLLLTQIASLKKTTA